ncbi:MAG: hypothetical protein FWG40_03400 [Peptococcaceae bacterium]|nr:hypothetical protein [Peptococcaceae bacterium]
MNDLLEVLLEAKNKLIFLTQDDFTDALNEIKRSDATLILDWDDGAGEEWARFIHQKFGKVCMLNSKIGILFVLKSYADMLPQKLFCKYKICIVEDYDTKEWSIDLDALKRTLTQIQWDASEDAVNPTSFSLDDFYFATI